MQELIKKLGSLQGLSNIEKVLQKYAENVLNPTIYDPNKKKYQSHLTSGLPKPSASAPAPKVLSPITS